MNPAAEIPFDEDRLLAFDVGGTVYALPIACVAEVAEVGRLVSIPSVPTGTAGVMNHHGDARPVFQRSVLLDLSEVDSDPTHTLVLSPRGGGGSCFGIFVDRILGLVSGGGAQVTGPASAEEQRSIDGREVLELDPERLFARAGEAIDNALERSV